MTFHQKYSPGTLIERIEGDVDALSNFFSQFIVRLLANAVLIIGVLVMLYREDWRAGLGLTVFTAIAIAVMLRLRQIGTPRWAAVRNPPRLTAFWERCCTAQRISSSAGRRVIS